MTVYTLATASQQVGDDAKLSVAFALGDRVIIHARHPETHLTVLDAHWSYAAAVELYERLETIIGDLDGCAGCDATIRRSTAHRADTGNPFGELPYCTVACSERHAEQVSTRPAGS